MSVDPVLSPVVAPPSKTLMKLVTRAVFEHRLIEDGDRVAVGISGGKDSLLLASALRVLQRRSDLRFDFDLIHLDQHQPGFQRERFNRALETLGFECAVIKEDTWSIVEANMRPGTIPCALCGRMRRGILNSYCAERGYNKLALGHHLDDAAETFFLNLLFQRALSPLKAATPSKVGVTTIRPLIMVPEAKIIAWSEQYSVPVVPCPVCDTYPESKRRDTKEFIHSFRRMNPDIDDSLREALYGPKANTV